MIANFSYKDTYGYYGLKAEPTFDELVKTFKKKRTVIPVPKDRYFKFWALGPYRAYVLDQSKSYNDIEAYKAAQRSTDEEAPEHAVFHTQESLGGHDPAWHAQAHYSDMADAYELALDAANEDYRQQQQETARIRREQLSSSVDLNVNNPVVMMHSDDLQGSQISHAVPAPRQPRSQAQWRTPHQQYAAAGIPQAPEFPSFEELNLQLSTPPAPLVSPSPHIQSARRVTPSLGLAPSVPPSPFLLPQSYEQMRQVARRRSDVD